METLLCTLRGNGWNLGGAAPLGGQNLIHNRPKATLVDGLRNGRRVARINNGQGNTTATETLRLAVLLTRVRPPLENGLTQRSYSRTKGTIKISMGSVL